MMVGRRPGPSLFPYTTLFRSHAKINLDLRVLGMRAEGFHELRTVFQALTLHDTIRCIPREGDRKSTRLNSSHLGISYAAFCLKKQRDTRAERTERVRQSDLAP